MQSDMQKNEMEIKYSIKYSARKTISIIVERDRSVVVRAPLNTSEEIISREVNKRKRLILEKISRNQKYPFPKPAKQFVSGETILYLGKHYKLYVTDNPEEGVSFDNKFFIGKTNRKQANKLFREWYIKSADKILVPKATSIAKHLGVSYNNISILDLKYRWGSCTAKDNIHFNWRIIKAPMTVIEYIIIHELTHLLEANHTPEFWNRIAIMQPNFEKAKSWLKEFGGELESDF